MALVQEMEDVQVHFPSELSANSFGRQAAYNARALQHAGGPVALHPALISRGVRRSLTWRAAQPNLACGAAKPGARRSAKARTDRSIDARPFDALGGGVYRRGDRVIPAFEGVTNDTTGSAARVPARRARARG